MDSLIRDSVCSPATERVISVKIRIDDFPDGRALVCGANRFLIGCKIRIEHIAAVAFLSIGIVHVGYKALEISAHEEWGMPWYFAIFSPGLVYVFPLIVCIVAYFFFSKELKKKNEE